MVDPNAVIKELRQVAARAIVDYRDPDSNGIDQDDANYLAELFQALDEWITRGGSLPDDWRKR